MSWFSTKKDPEAEETAPQPTGSFSINDMMAGPPGLPSQRGAAEPSWVEEAPEDDHHLNQPTGFTEVDFEEMRQARLKREAQPSFVERLERGEVEVGLGRATGGLVTLGNFLAKPFLMIFENTAVLAAMALIMVLLGFLALAGVEVLEWFVADM